MVYTSESPLESWAARMAGEYEGFRVSEEIPRETGRDMVAMRIPFFASLHETGPAGQTHARLDAKVLVYADQQTFGVEAILRQQDHVFLPMWEFVRPELDAYIARCRQEGVPVDLRAFAGIEDELAGLGISPAELIPDYETWNMLQFYRSTTDHTQPDRPADLAFGWIGDMEKLSLLFDQLPSESFPTWSYFLERVATDIVLGVAGNRQILWDFQDWFDRARRFEIAYEQLTRHFRSTHQARDEHELLGLSLPEVSWYKEAVAQPRLKKLAKSSMVARWILAESISHGRPADPVIGDPEIPGLFILRDGSKDLYVLEDTKRGTLIIQLGHELDDHLKEDAFRQAFSDGWQYWCDAFDLADLAVSVLYPSPVHNDMNVNLGVFYDIAGDDGVNFAILDAAGPMLKEAETHFRAYSEWFIKDILPWLSGNPEYIPDWWDRL